MYYQVVKHHVYPLDMVRHRSLYPIEKVDEVTSRAARVSGGQRFSCGWLQRAEEITVVRSATVIYLLPGTLRRCVTSCAGRTCLPTKARRSPVVRSTPTDGCRGPRSPGRQERGACRRADPVQRS